MRKNYQSQAGASLLADDVSDFLNKNYQHILTLTNKEQQRMNE